jgi:hypothetical protein
VQGLQFWFGTILNRNKFILRHIDKNAYGVEIGPSFNPVAPKSKGYNVHVIDHACREDLQKKYSSADIEMDKIEYVDFVWSGQSYADLTGKSNFYSWVIASHVIEHTPDLVGFINGCDEILAQDGVLALVIPDKRFCFDHFRPITGIGKVIDAHLAGHTIHSPGTVAECLLSAVTRSGQIAWSKGTPGQHAFFHTLEEARAITRKVIEDGEMVDSHAWCFTPSSFRLMIAELNLMGLIQLHEIDFQSTSGAEFYIILGRTSQSAEIDRLALMQKMELEIIEGSRMHNLVSLMRRWVQRNGRKLLLICKKGRR